jgi:hypothetical protein
LAEREAPSAEALARPAATRELDELDELDESEAPALPAALQAEPDVVDVAVPSSEGAE